ncbi:hypothetical protein GGQ74_002105 [Desulfobaculum xiamenense]|uniref:Uncharacterized protein n=1 Tax=Desulfobaculum xiamenense TaxID=995050 RepID=A0A846QPL1_9BACT|nr:hypothetical protein [Desulfobaculum xiamenense]NJB68432.1 hypothetical protein [Desulfobaculum xiamenense]
MDANKRQCLAMAAIIALVPLLLVALNRTVISRLYTLPHGIREADAPFYTFMRLTPGYRGRTFRPNAYDGVRSERYSVNALGLRGPQPYPGHDLVVLSGDSTLFGLELDDAQTIPALVGQCLGDGVDVLNAGIPGKALTHNLRTLEELIAFASERGVRLRVFVDWLTPGDLGPSRHTPQDLKRLTDRVNLTWKERMAARFPLAHHVYWQLRRPWNITAPIREATLALMRHERPCPPQTFPDARQPAPESAALLERMDALCRANGVRLVHVLHPRGANDAFVPTARAFIAAHSSAPVLDTTSLYPPNETLTVRYFGHVGPRQAQLLAKALAAIIDSSTAGDEQLRHVRDSAMPRACGDDRATAVERADRRPPHPPMTTRQHKTEP